MNLGGYGVELALKNMEYKAMDDSAIKKGQFGFPVYSDAALFRILFQLDWSWQMLSLYYVLFRWFDFHMTQNSYN